jgi:hypothetical protein
VRLIPCWRRAAEFLDDPIATALLDGGELDPAIGEAGDAFELGSEDQDLVLILNTAGLKSAHFTQESAPHALIAKIQVYAASHPKDKVLFGRVQFPRVKRV